LERNDYTENNQIKYNNTAPSQEGARFFDIRIWRVRDVAKYLGCTIGHVYNLVSQEKIPKIKKGKFVYFIPQQIHEWILEGDFI